MIVNVDEFGGVNCPNCLHLERGFKMNVRRSVLSLLLCGFFIRTAHAAETDLASQVLNCANADLSLELRIYMSRESSNLKYQIHALDREGHRKDYERTLPSKIFWSDIYEGLTTRLESTTHGLTIDLNQTTLRLRGDILAQLKCTAMLE